MQQSRYRETTHTQESFPSPFAGLRLLLVVFWLGSRSGRLVMGREIAKVRKLFVAVVFLKN